MKTATRADLRGRPSPITLDGSSHFPGSKNVGKKRGTIKNQDTPLGQTALFLVHKLTKTDLSVDEFTDKLKASGWEGTNYAVRKWLTGANGPTLGDLRHVSRALGYQDWTAFVADVGKHCRKVL